MPPEPTQHAEDVRPPDVVKVAGFIRINRELAEDIRAAQQAMANPTPMSEWTCGAYLGEEYECDLEYAHSGPHGQGGFVQWRSCEGYEYRFKAADDWDEWRHNDGDVSDAAL